MQFLWYWEKRNISFTTLSWLLYFLWIFMMLWSFGLYIWRNIGIGIHIYTALIKYDSVEQELEAQMGYSAGSVFLSWSNKAYI
jgi:hypothetical protein